MNLEHLTPEQAAELAELCRTRLYQRVADRPNIRRLVVDCFVDTLGTEEQINWIQSDPIWWPDDLPFNPETGQPWPDED